MQTSPPYVYAGESFASLHLLQQRISVAIDYKHRVVEREFFDPVLAAAVHERHHRLSLLPPPTSFKYMRNTKQNGRAWGDSLSALVPGKGWMRFSTKQVYRNAPWSFEREFTRICRDRWRRVHRPQLFKSMLCVVWGCEAAAVDVDHVDPTHMKIVIAVRALLDAKEAVEWATEVKYQGTGRHFTLPEGHKVTMAYDTMTRGGVYQMLCKEHHWEKDSNNG